MVFGRTDRRRAPAAEEPLALKILVAGGFGVGKTTMVGAVSEIRPLRTEESLTEAGRPVDDTAGVEGKKTTTVAMDFGRITLREDLVLYLFGTPGHVLTVPFGVVEVCQAGTSLTQPQSNFTVPPRFGSRTSIPSSPSSFAISTIATVGAPVRWAIDTVSPMWSPWPWVSRIVVGVTSSAAIAALGLPVRNGSIRTVVSPSDTVKQACPRNCTSVIDYVSSVVGSDVRRPSSLASSKPTATPTSMRETRFFGQQRLHDADPILGVRLDDRLADHLVVPAVEPSALLKRACQHVLQRRRDPHHEVLRILQPARIGDRGNGGIDVCVGVGAVRHSRERS